MRGVVLRVDLPRTFANRSCGHEQARCHVPLFRVAQENSDHLACAIFSRCNGHHGMDGCTGRHAGNDFSSRPSRRVAANAASSVTT